MQGVRRVLLVAVALLLAVVVGTAAWTLALASGGAQTTEHGNGWPIDDNHPGGTGVARTVPGTAATDVHPAGAAGSAADGRDTDGR